MEVGAAQQERSSGSRRSGFGRMFTGLFPRARAPVRAEEVPPPSADPTSPFSEGPPKQDEAPRQFEEFAREWQGISMQDNFDGFRIEASNQVTKTVQACHTLFLGTQLRETGYIYQFGPTFASEDGRTVLLSRIGLDGGVTGRLIKKLGSGWEWKTQSQSHLKEAQRNAHEHSLEYIGSDFTAGGKMIYQGAWLMGATYTKRVLPCLQLGGDLTLITTNGVTIGQLAARYGSGKDICSVQLGRTPSQSVPLAQAHDLKLNYVRRVSDRLSLGSQYTINSDQETGMNVAYEYLFRNARIQGGIDTEGKVNCYVQDSQGFGFSGTIDYFKSDYKFGVLFQILPNPEQPPM